MTPVTSSADSLAHAGTLAPAGTWVIDPARSTVQFALRHLLVGSVHGRFDRFTGSLRVGDDGVRAAGTVHAATLHTGNAIRDGRLHGPEFFDTERHPDIRFFSTRIDGTGEHTWAITGELTIKRTTRPIRLRARRVAASDELLEIALRGELSRSEFGITSAELLNAGISNTVKLGLHITLAPARGHARPAASTGRN